MNSWRKWRLACIVGITVAYAIVALSSSAGFAMLAFGDITQFLLLFLAFVLMVANAVSNRGQIRLFWSLMALGCLLWSGSLALWTLYEVVLRSPLPEPFMGDVILFIHVVPFMAAVALRPHQSEERKLYLSTLNFLMLLAWWVFLYAFIVFPDEYVVLNVAALQSPFRPALSGGKSGHAGCARHVGVEGARCMERDLLESLHRFGTLHDEFDGHECRYCSRSIPHRQRL